jgi:hypothetical protein
MISNVRVRMYEWTGRRERCLRNVSGVKLEKESDAESIL